MTDLTIIYPSNLPEKAKELVDTILNLEIIEVNNEQTEKSASDQIKSRTKLIKEFEELIEPIKKELKRPGVEFDEELRPITKAFKEDGDKQKLSLGKYQVSKTIQAAKTVFSTSKSKLVPKGKIVDIKMFIEANVNSGRSDELKEIFPTWNESALNKYFERHEIDGEKVLYPGTEVSMVPDVKVR